MVSSDLDFIIIDKQITTISTNRRWIHQTQPQIPGISEEERQRRRESNKLSTRINFIGWILEVGLFFCPIQTMVIHIYQWNDWPRIKHIYHICWCQEYPSYFHCFKTRKQALGVLLILAPTSQQMSLRCDIFARHVTCFQVAGYLFVTSAYILHWLSRQMAFKRFSQLFFSELWITHWPLWQTK